MAYFADADRSRMSNNALDTGHTVLDQRPEMHGNSAWREQRPQPGREPYEAPVAATHSRDQAQRVLDTTVGAGMTHNNFPNPALIRNPVQVTPPLAVAEPTESEPPE